jgi:hypothetical protein
MIYSPPVGIALRYGSVPLDDRIMILLWWYQRLSQIEMCLLPVR